MTIDFFGLFSVEALYIMLGLFGITMVAIILSVVAICKAAKMKKKYRQFMEGSDGRTIEALIKENLSDIDKVKKISIQNAKAVKDIYDKMEFVFQKIGIVKYDAFHEMGGKLSFALCMLDNRDNGYVVNVMHSNNGCFAYIKEIVKGESYIELGDEERQAVDQAVAGGMGDADLGKKVNDIIKGTHN
jgi:hypothetical protein